MYIYGHRRDGDELENQMQTLAAGTSGSPWLADPSSSAWRAWLGTVPGRVWIARTRGQRAAELRTAIQCISLVNRCTHGPHIASNLQAVQFSHLAPKLVSLTTMLIDARLIYQ